MKQAEKLLIVEICFFAGGLLISDLFMGKLQQVIFFSSWSIGMALVLVNFILMWRQWKRKEKSED